MIELRTNRLLLRDHRIEDLITHHELFSDEQVMYYLPELKTTTMEESKQNLEASINEINQPDRKYYFLRMEELNSKENVGEIGYTVTDFLPKGKMVHLGYFTHIKFWGKGYVTEALKAVMKFAFEENHVIQITTGCLVENVGSERVMQKCGMTKEAYYPNFEIHDGRRKDRVTYRMMKEDWMYVKDLS